MKSEMLLKEKAVHGTAQFPVAIYHLSYPPGQETFFYLHWHDEFELFYVYEGAISYTVEGKDFSILAGQGMIVQSNALHSGKSFEGQPCEACAVLFHPNLFGKRGEDSAFSRFVYPILTGERTFISFFTEDTEWEKAVLKCVDEIYRQSHENINDQELLIRSKLFEIWHHCYQNSIAAKTNGKKEDKVARIRPVLDYIQQNYQEEITLQTLADLFPMSEGQFCHLFKEVMDLSPIAYVIRYRILQSCTLLVETNWKIADIAKYVGFNNISYYNRLFIQVIGCTPGRYRAEGR